jgi:hypothetical protein
MADPRCTDPGHYEWSDADVAAFHRGVDELGTSAFALLAVFDIETGGTFNPHIANCHGGYNGYPGAVGLNQITPPAAKAMGISESERLSLLGMTVAQQMPYVVRYYKMFGNKTRGADAVTMYQLNIGPGTVPNEVIYSSGPNYTENAAALDFDHDGKITRTDLRRIIESRTSRPAFKKMLDRVGATAPLLVTSRSESVTLGGAALIAGLGLLAVGVALKRG